jgi:hypothetical protein
VYFAPDPTALASFAMLGGGIRGNSVPVVLESFGGGVFIQRNNYSLDGVMFTGNAAGLGGSLFVAANLTSGASMRNLVFANDDRAIRGACYSARLWHCCGLNSHPFFRLSMWSPDKQLETQSCFLKQDTASTGSGMQHRQRLHLPAQTAHT